MENITDINHKIITLANIKTYEILYKGLVSNIPKELKDKELLYSNIDGSFMYPIYISSKETE